MRVSDGTRGADGGVRAVPVGPAGGDVAGTYPDALEVVALQGTPVDATTPVNGQILKMVGGVWTPSAEAAGGVDYTATLWVDPNGSALEDGRAPRKPTTLANALSLATAGSCIVLAAGVYADPVTLAVAGVTLASVATSISSAGGSAPVRITGLVTVTAPNCRLTGIELAAGLVDSSATAGTTTLTECAVVGPLTLTSPAASQTLVLADTDFGSLTVGGASSGGSVLVRDTRTSGSITHTATGSLSVTVRNSVLTGAINVNNAGGSISVSTVAAQIAGGITVTAGSVSACTLLDTVIGTVAAPQPIILTGAGANTVVLANVIFDRAGSTIPVGAEATTTIVDFSGNVRAAEHSGVSLTAAGLATNYLTAAGTYSPLPGGVFGENYSFSAKNAPLATTSATLTSYTLHTTPTLNTGNYVINVTLVITGSAASSQLRVELLVDGISYGGPRVETGIAGGIYVFSGSVWAFWLGGVARTVEMLVALAGGTGTATALASTIHVWRGN